MAEGGVQSKYVKLTKDQEPVEEDIKPGELNQPIHVPQAMVLGLFKNVYECVSDHSKIVYFEGPDTAAATFLEIPSNIGTRFGYSLSFLLLQVSCLIEQVVVHKCNECGQVLPESFEPPADEPWTSGIFGCAEDKDSCWTGLFCPCVLFGRNVESLREDTPWTTPCVCHAIFVEGGIALAAATAACHGVDPGTSFLIGEGLLFGWWMCGIYTGLFRQSLQKKYHLKNSPCDPCLAHCCLHWCALCQEHREMKNRLSDNAAMPMTIVNPPPIQEMNAASDTRESVPSSANNTEQTNLEMQAL